MHNFKTYLIEATEGAHLQHIEDEVLDDPRTGPKRVAGIFQDILNKLNTGGTTVTVKWDGSPAVFFGNHPETGKFFVGTKSVMSKGKPRIIYSKADLKEHYPDSPELAAILAEALIHLPKIYPGKGIYQGDVMFTSKTKEKKKIGKEAHIVMEPNTIAYAIPESSKELYASVNRAKFGLVVHTKYGGPTMQDLSKSFNVNAGEFKKSGDVWVEDAYLKNASGDVSFPSSDGAKLKKLIDLIKKGKVNGDSRLPKYMKLFGVRITKENLFSTDPKELKKLFKTWFKGHMQVEAEKLKSEKGKEKKLIERNEVLSSVDSSDGDRAFNLYAAVVLAKEIVLRKFDALATIPSFVRTDRGFEITKPEGFVAINTKYGTFKLVDRLTFSRLNFANR